MTENEIKEAKELLKECDELFYVNFSSEEEEILNGISRLFDELEQYRAIGTVEELKSLKENGAFSGIELAQIASMQMKLKEYQSIGTIEDFKALKEKNEPKKVINIHKSECPEDVEYFGVDELYGDCPHCGGLVNLTWNTCNCGDCGGLIDWSE